MDLVTPVPSAPVPQSSGGSGNALNASVLNPSKELEALTPESIVKGVITAVDKAKGSVSVYGQTPEGKPFNMEIKMPLIPVEGSEVNIKILPISQRTPENPFPIKLVINPKASPLANPLQNSESMLQKGILPEAQNTGNKPIGQLSTPSSNSESISQQSVPSDIKNAADKTLSSAKAVDNASFSIKSNIITAEILYTAKNIPDIKLMPSLQPQNIKPEMQTVLKADASWQENPLPMDMVKQGTSLSVKIVQVEVPAGKLPAGSIALSASQPANAGQATSLGQTPTTQVMGENLPSRPYEQFYPMPNQPAQNQPAQTTQTQPLSSSPLPSQPIQTQAPLPTAQPSLPNETQGQPVQTIPPQGSSGNTTISSPNTNFTISGEVVSKPAVPHTVVANQEMTLSLNIKTEFPTGSLIKMDVVSLTLPEINPKMQVLNTVKPPPPDFTELNTALKELTVSNPKAAAEMLAKIPQPNEKLAQNLFNFVQAAKSGDVGQWLGAATVKALEDTGDNGRKITGKISADMLATSRIATEALGEWRTLNIPFLNGQTVQPVALFVKHLNDEEQGQETTQSSKKSASVRFLFELELSELGRTQIDGLTYPKEKELDLIIRNEKALPEEAPIAMRGIYAEALEAVGYKGTLTLLKTSDFIEIAAAENAEAFIPNSDIWA